MAKVRTSSREDAMKIARYVGCTGAHQDEKGNWLPCSSPEKLFEISERAAAKSALKRDKKKRRRFINSQWEELGQRGVMGIDTIEGGGLVSGKAETVCPPATSSIALNLKNRQNAIDTAGYGPLNPKEPNTPFWEKKAKRWSVTIKESKKQTCGNCAAFIKTPRMLDCIDKGLGDESGNAAWDVIDAGDLGYCEAFDFKCASARTCDAWISGGPITEEKATTEEKAATSTIIIGRAKPRLGDPDVYTDPNAARLRARKLGCIGIARRETPEGEIVWTPCTNVSDQRRRQGDTPLGRRDEARRFADMLQEVGGPARKRQRMRKYKTLVYQVDYKQLRSIGSQLRSPMQTIGRNIGRAGKCRGSARGMRSIRDGDGDGFICNPATGKDDLPIVGGNQMLQRFFQQLTQEKKGWAQKFKDNPFRADDTSFNTPDGDADKMMQNLARRGWLIEDQGTSIKITPPPEFRKRYLAVRAIKGEGAVDSIDGPDSIFNIGYHKWHPGNDHTGPEKELASKLLKNFGYDPLNDTLYSPYYDSPNGYDQIKDPNNIRKFANGVIPEFEGAPNAEKYLTDKPGAPEYKKPSVIDETLSRDIAKLDNERNVAQFQNLVQAGKAKYGNKDRSRKLDANSDDSVDEVEDFLALHEAGYGTDEVAEILNIDEDNLVNFMNDEGFNVSKGRIKSIIESLEKEEELRRKRRALAGNQQGPRRAPARGVIFREGQAAIPPKLNINQEATGRFTYGEHKEFLKFSAWADGTYKPPVRKEVLRAYLDQNPRTKALLRAENDRWFQQIYDLKEPYKPSPQEIIDHWDQWFLENIEGMISGAKNEVPKEILGLGLVASDLRRLIDIIVSKEKEEAMAALRDKPELLEMYDNVSWLRLLPLIGNARKAQRLFADRIAEERAMGRKHTLSDQILRKVLGGAKTPAKPSERVFGSSTNREGSASSVRNASDISLDDATTASLAKKVSEHNDKMRALNKPAWSMASIAKLKAVYRRGAGAFSTSHRPGMTRNQWAMGRVNAFLKMLRTGRPNSGKYVGDNDLLHADHPWKKRGVRQKSAFYSEDHFEYKVLPTIGGSRGGRFRRRASVYDPNAFDGDGDGRVQDETSFERPATPKRTVSLAELFERVKDPDGGFTISASKMDDVKSGWAIARKGQGIRIPASTVFDDDGKATEEGIDHLEAFLEMHKELFLAKPGKTRQITLGAWHDPKTKQIYFDVTDVYTKDSMSLEQAIAEANKQNQISIADLDELHAAVENDDWDNRTIFHSGGGDGKDLLPEGRFNKYLDFVRSRGADDRTNERSSETKPTQRKVVISDDGVDMMFASPIEELAEKHGVKQDWQEVRALPQPRRQEIADLYDEAEDLPAEEIQQEVREAYEALVKEVEEQFEILTKELGINVEFVDEDPYGNFYEMLDDYQNNKRLKIMRTSVTGSHPFMTDEQNDMFRAVHDAFGHLATGRGFDRHGEEAAYQAHKSMFSSTAVKAAATELRGQNAFLLEKGFFGPQKLVILPESMRKYLDILLGFKEAEKSKKMTAQEWSDFDNAYTNTGSHHVSLGRVVKR